MKYDNISSFQKHLKSSSPNHFAKIYLIVIKDSYLLKTAAKEIELALASSHEINWCDGNKENTEVIVADLNSYSLFAKERAIFVTHLEQISKDGHEAIEKYAKHPSDKNILILIGDSLPKNASLYRAIETAGVILSLAEEKPWEKERLLQDWIEVFVGKEGKKIDPRAAIALIQRSGSEYSLLEQELYKIITFVGEKNTIQVADIDQLAFPILQESVWKLGETIFQGKKGEALRIANELLEEDPNSFFPILRQLRGQCLTGWHVVENRHEQEYPNLKGTFYEKWKRLGQGFGSNNFLKLIKKIDQTEFAAKNGSNDYTLLFEILLMDI